MAKLFPQPAYAQLKGFLPSWSPSTWLSKLKRRVNFLSHPFLGHNSFFFSFSPEWTRRSCWCKNQALFNSFLHFSHSTLTENKEVIKKQTQQLMSNTVFNATKDFQALHSYFYVLSCASDILSTSFPEKDIPHSHKGNLQQRDGFLFCFTQKKISLLVINQPACILSWCFSFPWVGNSLEQPLKVHLYQKIKSWPKTDENVSSICIRCLATHWNGRGCWCSPHLWAFSWFLLLNCFSQPWWSHWKKTSKNQASTS